MEPAAISPWWPDDYASPGGELAGWPGDDPQRADEVLSQTLMGIRERAQLDFLALFVREGDDFILLRVATPGGEMDVPPPLVVTSDLAAELLEALAIEPPPVVLWGLLRPP